jgi:hypothetical protein
MFMHFRLLLLASLFLASCTNNWEKKEAPLMTAFSEDVDPGHVLPEYPRPQMVRDEWLNLNGLWQFQPGLAADESMPEGDLDRTILVPFPVESALSGVMERHDRLWYRRQFTIPKKWRDRRVLLHFGAVDWETEIFINGDRVGLHKGGYDPFNFDITDYLTGDKHQEIVVRVYDPTNLYGQPRGKQSLSSYGIMYTSTTGIWQTVWLEPVPETRIRDLVMIPDIDAGVLNTEVRTAPEDDLAIEWTVYREGEPVVTKQGKANTCVALAIPDARLWSPEDPFLYDVEVKLMQGDQVLDRVSSYFGMRKISVEDVAGIKKTYLNNAFLFLMGPLDQGFWPEGIYTAPTDEALRYDIRMMKAMGYNMVRKHIKVEPQRWYYWADKEGLLVWQDMPSVNSYNGRHYENQPIDTAQFRYELSRMVLSHMNSPSIITWVIFNERQGQHDTRELVSFVRSLDPSRLINQASGSRHTGAGDYLDIHSYPAPACPKSNSQVLAVGEYGGIGLPVNGHLWAEEDNPYANARDAEDLLSTYDVYANMLVDYKVNNGLSAAIYTEITDVETEVNGMMTYDRMLKVDTSALKKIHRKIIKADRVQKTIYLPDASQGTGQTWRYTTREPGEGWMQADYDDSHWATAEAGFGTKDAPGAIIGTPWNSEDIWIRQEFVLGKIPDEEMKDLSLHIHHDDAAEVYMNGILAADLPGWTSSYTFQSFAQEAKEALVENGNNMMAIHCHQDRGGQFIDAGLMTMKIIENEN